MKKLLVAAMVVVLSFVSVHAGVEANPGDPDLQITEALVEPVDTVVPNQVRVEITVANQGDADAGAFNIRWYPDQASNEVGCSFDVPGLAAGKRGTATCTHEYAGTGEMHWRAVVDEEAEIVESNEANNAQTGTVIVGAVAAEPASGYDLYVRRMDFMPAGAGPRDTVTLVTMIATDSFSSGEPYFPASHFRWRKGPNFPWQEETCPDDTRYLTCVKEVSFSYNQPGSYEVEVQADNRDEVIELDESNNTKTWTLVIGGQQPASGSQPDLVIENARFEPSPVIKGQPFDAVMTVRTAGSVAVTQPFSALWHFPDALGLQDCSWNFGVEIPPGASAEVACTRSTNAGPGHGPSWATVDTDNVIPESEEINNDVSMTIDVALQSEDHPDPGGTKPDLLIEDAHFEPVHPVPGADFKAVMTIRNNSPIAVTRPFSALWEFGPDLGLRDCAWTFDNGLGAGAARRLRCTRNSDVIPGQFVTAPTVDTDNVINESNEVNNDLPATLILYAQDHSEGSAGGQPDLVVLDFSLTPSPVGAGQPGLEVSFTVANQGWMEAGPSLASWYVGAVDLASGECEVPALLPGAAHVCQTVVNAPSQTGNFGAKARADMDSTVSESNELNNLADRLLMVVESAQDHPDPVGVPDLVIRNFSLSPNPVGRGQDLLIKFDVKNQGVGPAAASEARWSTPPGAGLSFRCSVPALQPGASFHCSTQLAAPSRKGGYGTRATADVDNVVSEGSLENNNSAQEKLTVQ